mmetsp:Transcript_3489/g.5365  ORF Transcript_3489/g.5365 Transcript_3489/m.5365 type:complete len:100 (-) Transcript_3489:144-443(-)
MLVYSSDAHFTTRLYYLMKDSSMVAYPEMTVQVKKYGRKFFPLLSDISTSEQKKELELSGVGRRYRAANTSRISANKPLKTLRELVTVAMVSRYGITVK